MKLDVNVLRYLTKDEFRVLTATEMGMKNHELVPAELVECIAGLRHGGAYKNMKTLLKHKLVHHDSTKYDGYRLTNLGYDYVAIKTMVNRGLITGVGRQIGVGKESGFVCHRNTALSGRKCLVTSEGPLFAGRAINSLTSETAAQEWTELESDVAYLTRSARLVQWYPGHIAKAEKKLREQLQLVDVVLEVRDCRIPLATAHPELEQWIGDKTKILVLNREDMVTTADKNAWAGYYASQGLTTILTNGQRGSGIMKLERAAKSVAGALNAKRRARGLLPRSVRAAVVGYPNVGKSSVINRLLKQSICETAPRPGVTRDLRWTRIAEGLDLMDAPGVLPMRIQDQAAATRLAICNDIGEASYAVAGVAAVLVEMLKRVPSLGPQVLTNRYKVAVTNLSGEEFLEELGQLMFHGDVNQAALRVLRDFRKGRFGWAALERPPSQSSVSRSERNVSY